MHRSVRFRIQRWPRTLNFDGLRVLAAAIVALEHPNLALSFRPVRVRAAPRQMRASYGAGRTGDRRDVRDVGFGWQQCRHTKVYAPFGFRLYPLAHSEKRI